MCAAGINENIPYVLTKWKDEYLIVAERRLGELQMRTDEKFKKLLSFSGDALDELVVHNPLTGREVRLVINNEVTSEFGTGIQAICPAHDYKSLDIAYHYNLPKEGFIDD
jgi:isoleucyl-tRNA synthetase